MFSRAHLLIQKDFEQLLKDKPWGIEAHPINDDNMFEWTAKVLGLKDSSWEGGVFRLYIKFTEDFNYKPPEFCFHTIPFHPNVDMITGRPCIDFLDNPAAWRESYSLSFLLITVQSLLSNPVLNDAVNLEAVEMMTYSPHTYKQVVQDCVSASQRVQAGLSAHAESEKVRFEPPREAPPPKKIQTAIPVRSNKLSFEDYHSTWSGIATSKTNLDSKNILLENIKDNPTLQTVHYGLPLEELQSQMENQLNEHSTLMYGKFRSRPSNEDLKDQRMEKVNQMRKIYLQPRTPRKTPFSTEGQLRNGLPGEEEPWEKEVDDLVAWTHKLDDEHL